MRVGHYLTSLERLAANCPTTCWCCPPRRAVLRREDPHPPLRDHHEERCGAIANACRTKALTASDMVPLIFQRVLDATRPASPPAR